MNADICMHFRSHTRQTPLDRRRQLATHSSVSPLDETRNATAQNPRAERSTQNAQEWQSLAVD